MNITPEQFCYWLKGFMEVADPSELNCTQTQIIKDHLDEVFNKVTPDRKIPKISTNEIEELPEGFKKKDQSFTASKRIKIKINGFPNSDFSSRRLC